MKIITCPESTHTVTYPDVRQLIQLRFHQNTLNMGHGTLISGFLVVEPHDTSKVVRREIRSCLRRIETADGEPIDEAFTPSFEWILEHPTCYEAAFIHCDRLYGVCVLIPKVHGIDSELLSLCATYAVPVPAP